jgi:hypothetical protein
MRQARVQSANLLFKAGLNITIEKLEEKMTQRGLFKAGLNVTIDLFTPYASECYSTEDVERRERNRSIQGVITGERTGSEAGTGTQ